MKNINIDASIDNYHLLEAGNKYFTNNDYKFKTTDQRKFTSSVLLSNRKAMALQVVTSSRKSLLFVLSMIVLDDHYKTYYIHFDRVPYDPLKLVNLKKLEKKKKRKGEENNFKKKKYIFY